MPLNNLKTLKQKIDSNLSLLDTKCPYARNLSSSLDILIQNNPNNTKAKMWIEGCIEMIVNIEKYLYYQRYKQSSTSKSRLLFLKEYMTKHQESLTDKFPQVDTFLNAIDTLLVEEGCSAMIKPWVKGVNKILLEIEKDIFYMEYLK